MANARCGILASGHMSLPVLVLRCPTTPYAFHYHGMVAGVSHPRTGLAPCEHKHRSTAAASACSDRSLADKEAADRKLVRFPRTRTAYPVFHA